MAYFKKNKIILFVFIFTLFLFIKMPSSYCANSDIPLTSNGGLLACNNAVNILKNYIEQRGYTYYGYIISDVRPFNDNANNRYGIHVLTTDSGIVYNWWSGWFNFIEWRFKSVYIEVYYNTDTQLFEVADISTIADYLDRSEMNTFARDDTLRYNSMPIHYSTGSFNNQTFYDDRIQIQANPIPDINPYIYQYDNPPMNEYKYDDLSIYLGGYNFNDFDSLYLNAYYCSSYNTVVVENVTTYYSWVQYRYKLLSDRNNNFDYDIPSLGTYRIRVPRRYLFSNSTFANGDFIKYTLTGSINGVSIEFYVSPIYTLSLSTQQITDIQNEKETTLQQETTSAIDNLDNSLNNIYQGQQKINDSLTNTTVDDINSSTLPNDTTTDITADGVNNIFNAFYNAFCYGDAVDIVIPFPHSNKNIIIPANYLYNILNNNNCAWIIGIVQSFYWYIISRYIIKDIIDKMNKIKSGDFEKIQNNNIKGDML